MSSNDDPEYPIDADDLCDVIELLFDPALIAVDDIKVRDQIYADLEKLPSTDVGPFSISFLNRQGGDSEWASLDVGDEGMEFSAGNHCYSPEVGGDTYSETIFKCWGGGGGSEGYLSDWLTKLNSLDRDTIKIDMSHEFQEHEYEADEEPAVTTDVVSTFAPPLPPFRPLSASERVKLTQSYRTAVSNPRLPAHLRPDATRHYNNLKATNPPRKIRLAPSVEFDSDLALRGFQFIALYMERGTLKFADVAHALAADLNLSLPELRGYLSCWYEGARYFLEDAGQPVDDMDCRDAVKGALSMIKKLDNRE